MTIRFATSRHVRAIQHDSSRWQTADTAALVLCALASLVLSVAVIVRRPDLVKGADFLFADIGHNLFVAARLLSGATLYRDVGFPYGPIGAYAYALTAGAFGNTPTVYLSFFTAVSAVNLCLGYALIRRAADPRTAIMITVALFAVLPIPGAMAGAFAASPYIVLERTLLLLIALAWTPPDKRTQHGAIALGIFFGAWQGVKFGGAALAALAIAIVDVLYLFAIGFSGTHLRHWLRALMITGAAFLIVELLLAGYAILTQPVKIAFDVLWPAFMLKAYAAVVPPETRWLSWGGWRLFAGQYLLPLSCAVAGVFGICAWMAALRRNRSTTRTAERSAGAVFVPLTFYAVASAGYFHHIYHFQQFFWALVPASAWAVHRSRSVRRAMLFAWAPGVLIVLRAAFLTAMPQTLSRVHVPAGFDLVVTPAMAQRLSSLQRFTQSETRGRPVLFLPCGSGWHYAYGVPAATRHTFFFAANAVRPYEEQHFIESFDRTAAVITCERQKRTDEPFGSPSPLESGVASILFSRVQPWMSESGCRMYRVRGS